MASSALSDVTFVRVNKKNKKNKKDLTTSSTTSGEKSCRKNHRIFGEIRLYREPVALHRDEPVTLEAGGDIGTSSVALPKYGTCRLILETESCEHLFIHGLTSLRFFCI